MKGCHLEKWLIPGSVLYALFSSHLCVAQVVGDTTLPVGERSLVTGNPNLQIDGGATWGGNLFHSFSQFSVPTGGSAYFNNAADVQNIFSRVTGGSISNIDGVIRANGTANLFLLNPNGILFGTGAQLNIGGSFVASTANSINFADNFYYSATNPQTTPLLTVSLPVGLQMGANPGRIAVQGNGYNLSQPSLFVPITKGNASTGLRVSAGQSLALVGGDIEIQGGVLTAEQGQIELGSVRAGQVSLGDRFTLSYQGIQDFGEIRLSQQTLVDASGGGVIQMQGNRVSLMNGSLVLIQNQGGQSGGSIAINASQSLDLSGTSSDGSVFGGLESQTLGTGSGADIAISTQHFVVRDTAIASAFSYGSGQTGNISVNATDTMQVIGVSSSFTLGSLIAAIAVTSGDTGNITLSTEWLTVLDGGSIGTTTVGTGRTGDVTVNAIEAIEVSGTNFLRQSNIAAGTVSGEAGMLTLNTDRLLVQTGGTINTATIGDGSAGSLVINARKSIDIDGRGIQFSAPSSIGAFGFRFTDEQPKDPNLIAPQAPTGASGNTIITTGQLNVTNGARIDVSNAGTGPAGILQIRANSIFLDNQAGITASTASGEGGNIQLQVRDLLLLRHNSGVFAIAGGTGNGGNIRINTSSLIAVPNENSDINADSVNARGGNVTINTSGLFGIEFRDRNTSLSDITATGASSELSGIVEINVQDVDPARGLTQLPTEVVDASDAIAQGCRDVQGSSFVVTGRGGLPPTPQQALGDDPRWRDWRTPDVVSRQPNTPGNGTLLPSANPASSKSALVEATGWVTLPDGKVILTASAPNVTSTHHWGQPVICDGL